MKTLKSISLIFLMAITLLGCNEEPVDITADQEINEDIANLLLRMTRNDGSHDNILDGASCFEFKFPFTAIVNGSEVVVEDEEDLQAIEDLLEEFADNLNQLAVVYPLTLILDDYSEVVVNDNDGLLDQVLLCLDTEDDDILCIDFIYPLVFSVGSGNNTNEIQVNSDRELFLLVADVFNDGVTSIRFPLSVIFIDGSSRVIQNAQELQTTLENAIDGC